ncbi:hypothetical protein PG997_010146 [Apiospora hydei]|uniref:Uncharacterized protein n=1 Tax=Apiospora hydei TaxID=1337664 RepID=A0ABR1W047_9PEZI
MSNGDVDIDMNTRKRSASADADDGLQSPATKHPKVEQDESISTAAIPENATIPMLSDNNQDITMPDVDSKATQDNMPNTSSNDIGTAAPMTPSSLATFGPQVAIANLSKLSAEETNKILVSIIDQLGDVLNSSNTTPILNPALMDSSSRAGMQPDEANANVPMLSSKFQDTMDGIEENDATIEAQNATIREYKVIIEKLNADKDAMQEKWNEAETKLQDAIQHPSASYSLTEVIDDNCISEEMNLLSDLIQTVAEQRFSNGPFRATVKAEFKDFFDKITHGWAIDYLRKGPIKPYFIEAIIWHKVIDAFLCRPLVILCEATGDALQDLHRNFWSYHSMRVHVAEVSLQVRGKNGHLLGDSDTAMANRAKLVKETMKVLDPYTHRHNLLACQQEINTIIKIAVNLAYSMAMTKAHYVVRLNHGLYASEYHGFNFKPGSMTKIEEDEDKDWNDPPEAGKVHLAVRPALIRYGTSEGEDYDVTKVIAKAQVITG